MAIIARSTGEPTALTGPLRDALVGLDPNLALYRVMTLERAMHDARWNPRMATVLLRRVVLIGAILALVGLYAVTRTQSGSGDGNWPCLRRSAPVHASFERSCFARP